MGIMRNLMKRTAATLMVATAIVLIAAGTASAATATPWITQKGTQWVSTTTGKPVTLHGVNMSWGCHDAAKIPQLWPGANFVRLSVPWSVLEPKKGVYDFTQLNACIKTLQREHLNVLVVNHQFWWSTYFPGGAHGIPEWYYADGRFPKTTAGQVAAQLSFFRKNGERARSQAAFDPMVDRLTKDISQFPTVMGEEIWNEPKGQDTQRATQTSLCWQAAPLHVIRTTDPRLSVGFMTRGGGDLGLMNAKLDSCFIGESSDWRHIFLDVHSYLTGLGYVYDSTQTAWNPGWNATHNQDFTNYHGTRPNQWLNLRVMFARTQKWDIPLMVGEFGVRNDDSGAPLYNCQMVPLLQKHGISWAAFTMDRNLHLGLVNTQGQFEPRVSQIRTALAGGCN